MAGEQQQRPAAEVQQHATPGTGRSQRQPAVERRQRLFAPSLGEADLPAERLQRHQVGVQQQAALHRLGGGLQLAAEEQHVGPRAPGVGIVGPQRHCAQRHLVGASQHGVAQRSGLGAVGLVDQRMGVAGERGNVLGVERQRMFEAGADRLHPLRIAGLLQFVGGGERQRVGARLGFQRRDPLQFRLVHGGAQRHGQLPDQRQRRGIAGRRRLQPRAPQRVAVAGVDQVDRGADLACAGFDAAVERVAHVQVAAELLHIAALAAEPRRDGRRDHLQPGEL